MLSGLKPQVVWEYFAAIGSIPHESRNEGALAAYLSDEAQRLGCAAKSDSAGNLIIRKAPCVGCENAPAIIIRARGTTLGADNGIGIAVALAILADDELEHGSLEVLLSTSKEAGVAGVQALQPDVLQGKYLINLDCEEAGIITIGSAGFAKTSATRTFVKVAPRQGKSAYRISVSGLRGGHSGVEIDKGLGNAVKILTRLLCTTGYDYDLDIVSLNGGESDNAIPREAVAEVMMSSDVERNFRAEIVKMQAALANELKSIDQDVKITLTEREDIPEYIIDGSDAAVILSFINALPHGVIKMMSDIPDLPMVSSNCAAVITQDSSVKVLTSQRSMIDSALGAIISRIQSLCFLAGFAYESSIDCGAWQPDISSRLLEVARTVYKKNVCHEASVQALHAGLECGIIMEKYPGIEAISIGSNIYNAHSPDENVEIASVDKFYKYVIKLIEALAV